MNSLRHIAILVFDGIQILDVTDLLRYFQRRMMLPGSKPTRCICFPRMAGPLPATVQSRLPPNRSRAWPPARSIPCCFPVVTTMPCSMPAPVRWCRNGSFRLRARVAGWVRSVRAHWRWPGWATRRQARHHALVGLRGTGHAISASDSVAGSRVYRGWPDLDVGRRHHRHRHDLADGGGRCGRERRQRRCQAAGDCRAASRLPGAGQPRDRGA